MQLPLFELNRKLYEFFVDYETPGYEMENYSRLFQFPFDLFLVEPFFWFNIFKLKIILWILKKIVKEFF